MRSVLPYPVDFVFSPSWWNKNAGISFDEGFFFDARRRVEDEQRMERTLRERFGEYGFGSDADTPRAELGGVHLASGFMLSWMMGCKVEFFAAQPPVVHALNSPSLRIDEEAVFSSEPFKRLERLADELHKNHSVLTGDIDFNGILNMALDVRGQELFFDLSDEPEAVIEYFEQIARVIERFTDWVSSRTGTTSISVNRTVRHLPKPVFLHSECSHTMISADTYAQFIEPIDRRWSQKYDAFGIHYCGSDPHRFKDAFARLPKLDFLDLGWGGDVAAIRRALPDTFLNLRLSPTLMRDWRPSDVRDTIERLVRESEDAHLTGVCCINMDQDVPDENVRAMLEAVRALRSR